MSTIASTPITRVCSTCGFPKPLDDFSQRPNGKHGRRGQCRTCRRRVFERQRARRKLGRTRQTLRQIANAESEAKVVRLTLALLNRFRGDPFAAALQLHLATELGHSNREIDRGLRAAAKIVAAGTRIARRRLVKREREARERQLREQADVDYAEDVRLARERRRIFEEHERSRRESEERDAEPADLPPNVIVGDATDLELQFEQAQLRRRGALDVDDSGNDNE